MALMTSIVAAPPATRLTTLWGGVGVAASAALSLVIGLPFVTVDGVTALSWYSVPSGVSSVVSVIAALLLAVALYGLGFGIRGEAGLVGDSRVGRLAVRVFAVATVVNAFIRLATGWANNVGTGENAVVFSYVQMGLGALALACVIIAVVVVVGHGIMNRALRWGIIVTTAWFVLIQAISFPLALAESGRSVMTVAIVLSAGYAVALLLQLVLGIAIALHGQADALRRRAAIIEENW